MFFVFKIASLLYKMISPKEFCLSQIFSRKRKIATRPVPLVGQVSRKKARLEENLSRKRKLCTGSLPLVNQVTLKKPRFKENHDSSYNTDVVPLVVPSAASTNDLEAQIIVLKKELTLRDEKINYQQGLLEQSEEGRKEDKEKIREVLTGIQE